MYVYSCNALSARFSAVYRALNSYFMIMIMGPTLPTPRQFFPGGLTLHKIIAQALLENQ